MNHQIDILLAIYNGSAYIIPQLQSILAQTYQDFHIIIRDNYSEDDTIALIESFAEQHPEKITLIRGKENLGVRGNFATLAAHAAAPYIMFSDGDDIWLPAKIADTLALMRKNETSFGKSMPILIHTDLTVVDKNLNVIDTSFWSYSHIKPTKDSLNRLLIKNVITGCTMMINQSLLTLALPIPQEAIMHDYWIGLVASTFGKIDLLKTPTLLYRQHGKNDTGAKHFWSHLFKMGKETFSHEGRHLLRKRISRHILQAEQFLKHYRHLLDPTSYQICSEYIALPQTHRYKRLFLILKNRYFGHSIFHTLGIIIL